VHYQDRDQFARAVLVLGEAVQQPIPEGYLDRLWAILERYPWPVVERGLQEAMHRHWSGFPTPAGIGELIETGMAQEAERQWLQLLVAVRDVGAHHSIRCEDPALAEAISIVFATWPEACRRLREAEGAERTMLRKDFLRAYRMAWDRALGPADTYLPGLREVWHERGLPDELLPVVQIGAVDRPQTLDEVGGGQEGVTPVEPPAEPAECLPPEQAQQLLADLVKQLSMPAVSPRPPRRRLPPASVEDETPEQVEAARRRRDAQLRQAREAGLIK
jgi:hypothetical protein